MKKVLNIALFVASLLFLYCSKDRVLSSANLENDATESSPQASDKKSTAIYVILQLDKSTYPDFILSDDYLVEVMANGDEHVALISCVTIEYAKHPELYNITDATLQAITIDTGDNNFEEGKDYTFTITLDSKTLKADGTLLMPQPITFTTTVEEWETSSI